MSAALTGALRAHATGLYPDEAGTELLIRHGGILLREDFAGFVHTGTSISDGTTLLAWIDWDAALRALHHGQLPLSVLLTELPDVAAAQDGQSPPQPIVEVSETSRSPGRGSHVASLIATETGHTVLNHLPSFSSLQIFDVSRGGPRASVQPP